MLAKWKRGYSPSHVRGAGTEALGVDHVFQEVVVPSIYHTGLACSCVVFNSMS